MNNTRRKVHLRGLLPAALALLLALAALGAAAPADAASREQQLKALLQKIGKLKQVIDVKEDSKSQYIRQLEAIERELGALNRKIRAINEQVAAHRAELEALRQTRRRHQQKISRESEYLAEQVYTAYTLGRQERVKLLFSLESPEVLQRNLAYYRYFSDARADLIATVQDSVDEIVATERRIDEARAALETREQALAAERRRLDADRDKRQSIIAALDAQLKQQSGSLSRLEDEARQLQELIDSIREIFVDAPEGEIARRHFAELRGRLAWPVEGKLRRLYGQRKPLSDLRWQGVMIEAPNGRQVRAVSHGRVAFADWLRGYGNLIIIDHGDSYLSLYGHNESLFKSAGDWVDAGEVISSIGSSGGQKQSGLYFEIRRQGKPQNPTGWCKAGNRFAAG